MDKKRNNVQVDSTNKLKLKENISQSYYLDVNVTCLIIRIIHESKFSVLIFFMQTIYYLNQIQNL